MKTYIVITILLSFLTTAALAEGNRTNQSFLKAKKTLMRDVYTKPSQRHTIYCNASFDEKKIITTPEDFSADKHVKRSRRIEWEHVVPAENFGRTFSEWRNGHHECIDNKGKSFKGRKCAEKINTEYRYMQSDMFNLYPAIGSVNAMRSNYNFVMLPDGKSSFGSCDMQIKENKAQPPEKARGTIARSYLYMELSYKRFKMSKSQRQLMTA
jgi:deoxyribonuclease-1